MAVATVLSEGEPVYYAPDPCLYGEMEVAHLRKAKDASGDRLIIAVCRVDPDRPGPAAYEVFAMDELEPVPKE